MADLVIDASLTLGWLFEESETPNVVDAYEPLMAEHDVWAPPLWKLEVTNAVLQAVRRGRVSDEKARVSLAQVERFPINLDPEPPAFGHLFHLATQHSLTAYDAAYLELAIRRGCALATLDSALLTAAKAAHVPLLLPRG